MNFKLLSIKNEYRSFNDDIIRDFYIPILQNSVKYDRAVGYFSSTALIDITKGISTLIRNNGKIRLIVSPNLSFEDIEAITVGYKQRDDLIKTRLLDSFEKQFNIFEKKRLNLLAYLISNSILEIKIALINQENAIGIFHDKLGLVEDNGGNIIAFSGSMNETAHAFTHNYESIDVFKSWTSDAERVISKKNTFELIWNNKVNGISTAEFPQVVRDKIMTYNQDYVDFDIDEKEYYFLQKSLNSKNFIKEPSLPFDLNLREYQKNAIKNWIENDFRGIFDMATGTGKTVTSLAAASDLARKLDYNIAIVIVCPYQHLVEQWVDSIRKFDFNPIIGYSTSKQRQWKDRLVTSVEAYNLGVKKIFCFVTTNATFATEFVQTEIKKINRNFLIIVDEAHNFGAEYLSSKLPPNANFRLALSATIQRHNDENGTQSLLTYFGEICYEYTLEKAIKNGMLTPYYYYPVLVFLTDEELFEYRDLTMKIGKFISKDSNGKYKVSEYAKMLLLKRAKLVAGAESKVKILAREIEKYSKDSHILIYCGATTVNDLEYSENNPSEDEIRQIDAVINVLGNTINMKVSKFTSEENATERELIKRGFQDGEHIQALVAIRCLDEGVDIPSIQKAFILASSTNPKEYIQRRGRVLRKSKGKNHAEIYDFITLPIPFEDMTNYSETEIKSLKSLPIREIDRMKDFAAIAENSSFTDKIIKQIEKSYLLNREDVYVNVFREFE